LLHDQTPVFLFPKFQNAENFVKCAGVRDRH
jgi:hypothetical protein